MSHTKYHVIFRACEDVYSLNTTLRNIPDQRPFGLNKSTLIERCFESLVQSLHLSNVAYELWVVGDRLSPERVDYFKIYTSHLVLGNFGNEDSIRKTFEIAGGIPSGDWVYFCEDDYLHRKEAFSFIDDLILHREGYLGQLNRYDLFIYPPDYPDRYLQPDPMVGNISRNIIVHSKYSHWRQIPSTTFTFLCSSDSVRRFKNELEYCAGGANDQALSKLVYSKSFCISPVPALSTHMHENAMSPVVDWSAVFGDGSPPPCHPGKTSTKEVKDISSASASSFDRGNLAVECRTQVPKVSDDSFNGLGQRHLLQGDLMAAEKTFLEILRSDPENVEAYNNLGVLEFSRNNPAAAMRYFGWALEIDPFDRDAVFNLADVLKSIGKLPEALPYLEKVRDRYPNDRCLRNLIEEIGTGGHVRQNRSAEKSLPWKLCYSPGIPNHGENARRLLGLEHYVPSLHIHEPVWFFGLYFDCDYHQIQAHLGKKIINWRGADTMRMLHKKERVEVIQKTEALHVCQAEHQKELLAQFGISSIVRPMMNTPVENVEVTPFPEKETEILVYWRAGDDLYIQADLFFEIAAKCPEVIFHVLGNEDPARFTGPGKENIHFHGYLSEEELDSIMDRCKGTIRPWVWDGNPNLQTKMLLKGRYAAHSWRFPKVAQCCTADDYVRWIHELKEIRSPNTEAREWWMKNLNNFDFLEPDFEISACEG